MADIKKERTLSEIFSRYSPITKAQRDLFQAARDVSVRADRERRMVEVNFSLPAIVNKTVLYEAEEALREIYAQNSVRLFPHYPKESFSLSYMHEVINEAKRIGSDYIVVGRPITAAADPVAAYRRCVAEFVG